ncbi:hypothetical protein ACH5RR_033723, partial [Cinchona calisaya]
MTEEGNVAATESFSAATDDSSLDPPSSPVAASALGKTSHAMKTKKKEFYDCYNVYHGCL